MKGNLKGKRAVSPVLATLLMIAVAVSMSVILFMWSQNFLASTSEAASSQQQAQNVAAQSSIAIEAVQFTEDTNWDADGDNDATNDNDGIVIVVRNVGTSKVTVGGLYIDSTPIALPSSYDTTLSWPSSENNADWVAYDSSHNAQSSAEVPPGGYAKIQVAYDWTAGENYIIKVTTTVGTFAETVVTAPA